jgi:hypothetical protein
MPEVSTRPAALGDPQEVRPGVVLDFDAQGRLVGIDIDHASRNAAIDSLDVEDLPLRKVAG